MKLKKRINPEVERKLNDAIFVGRLVREDELAGTPLGEPVYFKDEFNDDIQFHIKCLSPIPEEVSKQFYFPNKIFTGGTRSSNNYRKLTEWIDYDRIHHFEKKDKIREYFENKIIVFKMNVKPEYIYVELIKVEDTLPSEKGYSIVPGPQLRLNEEKEDFEKKLVEIHRPFTLKHYPHIFDLPEFIYYQGNLYKIDLKASTNTTTYTQQESHEVVYSPSIDELFMNCVDVRIDDHLFFVQQDRMPDLRDAVDENGRNLNSQVEVGKMREVNSEQVEETRESKQDQEFEYKYNKAEIDFINLLEKNAKRRGLYFNNEDLFTFHISVKTNLLSIIGGMSGTGKSQLAKLYGETMGLEYGEELLMIPVSPSYHEPNDILGYLNPTTGVYHESETGLVNLLIEAEETPEKMFMVIFDEMNLSQVEHWFSPFISLLELEESNRYLTLFNENSYCVNNKYKPRVKIGNNIIFVGTVNFDETTKNFSDRLLDRTNVIRPTKLSFKESLEIARNEEDTDEIETFNVQATIYRNEWFNKKESKTSLSFLTAEEVEILDELHNLLNKNDFQKGVSFRVALGISRFLANIPSTEEGQLLINRSVSFDMQVNQRVLTKIKGLESYVEPLVGTYSEKEYFKGEIVDLLTSEKAQQISSFDKSIAFLKSKAKELMLYGYAN
ncbi:hypothetical protein [Virgibacillus senegalensis]|uniref:hypothetical protein n=1 Tax=Virgibacillus senegalensis TaxID=1499679 RepID=UPI00069F851A|nr:hypothetical protein [Virgibacillus senegalensis]